MLHKLILASFALIFATEASIENRFRKDYQDVALNIHNQFRRLEGLAIIELDQELNRVAQAHAENLSISGTFDFRAPGCYENLWAYRGEQRQVNENIKDAVTSWFTGSQGPPGVLCLTSSLDYLSERIKYMGIGIGTENCNYTVVVADYR